MFLRNGSPSLFSTLPEKCPEFFWYIFSRIGVRKTPDTDFFHAVVLLTANETSQIGEERRKISVVPWFRTMSSEKNDMYEKRSNVNLNDVWYLSGFAKFVERSLILFWFFWLWWERWSLKINSCGDSRAFSLVYKNGKPWQTAYVRTWRTRKHKSYRLLTWLFSIKYVQELNFSLP